MVGIPHAHVLIVLISLFVPAVCYRFSKNAGLRAHVFTNNVDIHTYAHARTYVHVH